MKVRVVFVVAAYLLNCYVLDRDLGRCTDASFGGACS